MIELRKTRDDDRLAAFDLLVMGQRIGFCQIRRQPSHAPEVPAEAASHFYFELRPDFRGQGFGKRLLTMALAQARQMGLAELIVTSDENNLASRGAIKANDGTLTGVFDCADGTRICRYVFPLAPLM